MTAFELSSAFIADWFFGDPRGYPHPVKVIGRAIGFIENRLLRRSDSPLKQRFIGIMLAGIIVGGSAIFTWAIIRTAEGVHPILSSAVTVFLAYTTLSARSLYDEVKKVINLLEQGDLTRARKETGLLVSRDTTHLDERGICRALIETTSENTSDGIVAPLFYLAIGGPALAMAYKALNTLDSMVGYKNERYQYFGWASAKVDDWANFIPARLTAILFGASAMILRKDWKKSFYIAWRDGHKNPSPNSGYPEAAVAGALGVQLGGVNFYFCNPSPKPFIGEPQRAITLKEVKESLHLMMVTSLLTVMTIIPLTFIG